MRKFPFRNSMLWLTILTLLWSSQGQGYVWCVTADGPTHLESALENHCDWSVSSATGSSEPAVATFAGEETPCGPCFDLDATHDILQHRILSGFDLVGPFLLSSIVRPEWVHPVLVRYLDNNLILEPPPRLATSLLVHRTTVLLI